MLFSDSCMIPPTARYLNSSASKPNFRSIVKTFTRKGTAMKIIPFAIACLVALGHMVAAAQEETRPVRDRPDMRRRFRDLQVAGGKEKTGFKPLSEMSASDRYKGQ